MFREHILRNFWPFLHAESFIALSMDPGLQFRPHIFDGIYTCSLFSIFINVPIILEPTVYYWSSVLILYLVCCSAGPVEVMHYKPHLRGAGAPHLQSPGDGESPVWLLVWRNHGKGDVMEHSCWQCCACAHILHNQYIIAAIDNIWNEEWDLWVCREDMGRCYM